MARGVKRGSNGEPAPQEDATSRKEEVLGELTAKYQQLDADGVKQELEEAQRRWGVFAPDATFGEILQRAFQLFDIPLDSGVNFEERETALIEIDVRIWEEEARGMLLLQRVRDLGEQLDVGAFDSAGRVLEQIFYAKRAVFAAVQSKHALLTAAAGSAAPSMPSDLDARLGSWGLRFRWMGSEQDKLTNVQQLLLYLLDVAQERGYRKSDGQVFEPIIIDGHNTHAWRSVCDIQEFVHYHTRKEIAWEQWTWLTSGGGNLKQVVDHLSSASDFQFPFLKKDRSTFSFRNGVYLAAQDKFVRFGTEQLPSTLVAAKYFDLDFPDEYALSRAEDIPTPHLDSVGAYQNWAPEVHHWFMVMAGRMLYDVGDRDGWQVLPYLHGAAGSGKSLLTLSVVKAFYDPSDVGTLSNNCERKWVLSSLADKFIFVAPECRNDMQLEQSEFQSVVSGESVSVARKFKTAQSLERWRAAGWMAGNEIVNWADASGSIQRRIVVFDFPRAVRRGDMLLNKKLAGEMGFIILKANKAYLQAAAQYGSRNLWEVLPDYFKRQQQQLAADVNSVEAFLGSSELKFGPELYVPLDVLKKSLKAFEQVNNYKSQKYSLDAFRQPFERRDLRIERTQLPYQGRNLSRDYVIGCDVVAAAASELA